MENDAALLARYARHDAEEAFAEVARRHVDAVYSMALRRVGGDTHLAQDVTQEVFVALARQSGRLASHPVLLGWFFTTTRNVAVGVVRRECRRKAHEQEAHTMQEALAKGPPEPDWQSVAPLLEKTLDELDGPDRSALLLRFFGRHTFVEIGAALQLSEEGARKRVARALERLRARIARGGLVPSSAVLAATLSNHAVGAAPTGLAATVTSAALTASPAAIVATTGVLGIMQTTKLILGAGLFMVAALGTAVYQNAARRTVEAALSSERDTTDAARARQRDAEARAQSAERVAADLGGQLEAARAGAAAAAKTAAVAPVPPAASAASAAAMTAAGNAFLARHPEVKRALVDWRRAEINLRYAGLFKTLALSPARLEEFKTLLLNAGDQYTGPYGPNGAFVDLRAGNIPRDEIGNRLRAFLSDDEFRKFDAFHATIEPRRFATKLAGSLALGETPLTPEQADQLVRVLTEHHRSLMLGIDWDAAATGVGEVLSTAQLAAFQRVKVQTQAEYATMHAAEVSAPASTSLPTH